MDDPTQLCVEIADHIAVLTMQSIAPRLRDLPVPVVIDHTHKASVEMP